MTNPTDGKTLRIGLVTAAHHLDPFTAQDFQSAFVVAQVYETPYAPPKKGEEPAPLLFSEPLRLESSPGEPQVYSAPVRSGVTFSDGTPLTVERVVESLASSRRLADLTAVEARGDRVVFRLTQPDAHFQVALTQRYASVVLRKGGELLGTGPYLPAPDSRPERIHLVQNPRYREPVDIEELLFVTYPLNEEGKPEALVEALAEREVDFCNVLTREQISGVKGMRKWMEPGSSTAILYFNSEHPSLADARVRRALALAVDRAEVTRICYPNPLTFTATSLLPPLMGRWQDGLSRDLQAANRLLRQEGVEKPERLSLLLIYGPRPYLPNPRAVAEELKRQIGELGIEVDIRPTADSEDYYPRVARGDYDMVLSGWIADTPDPADFLETLLGPDAIPSPDRRMVAHANLSRWRSPEAAAALERFRAESSDASRDEIRDLVSREVPLLPLMYGPTIYVYTPRLEFEPYPLGIPLLHEAKLG